MGIIEYREIDKHIYYYIVSDYTKIPRGQPPLNTHDTGYRKVVSLMSGIVIKPIKSWVVVYIYDSVAALHQHGGH